MFELTETLGTTGAGGSGFGSGVTIDKELVLLDEDAGGASAGLLELENELDCTGGGAIGVSDDTGGASTGVLDDVGGSDKTGGITTLTAELEPLPDCSE